MSPPAAEREEHTFDDACWPQGVCLAVLGLTPCLAMLLVIMWLHDVVGALFTMHGICMTLLPAIFIRWSGQTPYYRCLLRYQLSRWRMQWSLALPIFIGTFSASFGAYLLFRCHHSILPICIPLEEAVLRAEGFRYPFWQATLVGVYFTFINPAFEEWFWRNFVYRELGGRVLPTRGANFRPLADGPGTRMAEAVEQTGSSFAPAGPTEEPHGASDEAYREISDRSPSHPAAPEKKLPGHVGRMEAGLTKGASKYASQTIDHSDFPDVFVSEAGKWLVSSYYASYHFIIVFQLCNALVAFLGFLLLIFYGRLMIFARNHLNFGLVNAYWSHAGLDAAVVAAIANVLYLNWV